MSPSGTSERRREMSAVPRYRSAALHTDLCSVCGENGTVPQPRSGRIKHGVKAARDLD
jgi:hypothetical protein